MKLAIFAVLGIFLIAGCLHAAPPEQPPEQPPVEPPVEPPVTPPTEPPVIPPVEPPTSEVIIQATDAGFNPNQVEVSVGTIVTFRNMQASPVWPASAFHPTHTEYPGSGISKCGTSEVIFDACSSLAEGESYSFTFNEIGTWGYHNHLNSGQFGQIVVS